MYCHRLIVYEVTLPIVFKNIARFIHNMTVKRNNCMLINTGHDIRRTSVYII